MNRGGAVVRGGVYIHVSGSARLICFEINLISNKISREEPGYINMHPPPPPTINALGASLPVLVLCTVYTQK